MRIKRIEIVNLERDLKKHIMTIIGIILIILGVILLWEYIWHFFKIFLGALLILLGFYFILTDRLGVRYKKFRF